MKKKFIAAALAAVLAVSGPACGSFGRGEGRADRSDLK